MTTKEELGVLTLLRSVDELRSVGTKQLKCLASLASQLQFEADEVLYSPGDAGKSLFLVRSGRVVVEIISPEGERIKIADVGPNQFFGWSALFPWERKLARTRAVEPTQVCAFRASRLRSAWQKDRKLEFLIIRQASKAMADRVKASRVELAKVVANGH